MDTREFPLKLHSEGKAPEENVFRFGSYRFTLLTSRLVRIEFSREGRFADRVSQAVWFRNLGHVPAKSEFLSERFRLETDDLVLECRDDSNFGPASGSLTLRSDGSVWHFGDPTPNLKGTARTLDGVSGKTALGDGIVSREGFSVLDDSLSLLLDDNGWPTEEGTPRTDLYFFGYGHDFAAALSDYYRISGSVPLVPRYVLGNWWSKYWAYRDRDLLEVVDRFREMDIPLSVCIVDMDWHVTAIPGVQDYWAGWTGYTVNPKYFPDFPGFLSQLHARGLKTSVNLHPANGVKAYEERYREFADFMGLDPASATTIPFDAADPRFMKGYFRILLRPFEQEGVDFWWIDWQQGTRTAVKGLDPLWMLNHLHYFEAAKNPDLRPFTFSRWSGPGAQRYPIGFSGDAKITWDSLRYQPYFTSTAANIGFSMWSHDIGGHFAGTEDPELFVRWVQFGALSPILRLHSTANRFCVREPWRHGPAVRTAVAEAMRLRHRLVPYLYTACEENHRNGLPPVLPLYYREPEAPEAYANANGYFFGPELLVQPVTNPMDPSVSRAETRAWFPSGRWIDWFTGEIFEGRRFHRRHFALDRQGLYAREGAIVPLSGQEGLPASANPDRLVVRVFPGADGDYVLFEDDGISPAYRNGEGFRTRFGLRQNGGVLEFTIVPDSGEKPYLPPRRVWEIRFENWEGDPSDTEGIQEGNAFVVSRSGTPYETQSLRVKGNPVPANRAILAALDSFLVDQKETPDFKTAVYDAFAEARSKAAVRRSFLAASAAEKRVLEAFLLRLRTSRKG